MSKLSINLLPQEVLLLEKSARQKALTTRICIAILSVFVVLSLGLIILRLFQTNEVTKTETQLSAALLRVKQDEEKENVLLFLKQRINLISKILQEGKPHIQAYNLILSLSPPSIRFASINIDKNGNINISASSSDTKDLKLFFDNLVDPEKTGNKISEVVLEGVGKTSASDYRFDLVFKYK